jgi:hypothetical protein
MQRDRKRMTKAVAIVMLVGMVGLVGASLAVNGNGTTTTSTTTTARPPVPTSEATTTTIDPAQLGAEAKELDALAAKGRAGRFHVRFDVAGDVFGPEVTAAAVELWRADGRLRQDTSRTAADGVTTSQIFAEPDRVTQCLQKVPDPVTCTDVSGEQSAHDDLLSGVQVLVHTGSSVTATDDTALGAPVRCFAVGAETLANSSTVCFNTDGVPLRLVTPHFTLTAIAVDGDVDDETFSAPAG